MSFLEFYQTVLTGFQSGMYGLESSFEAVKVFALYSLCHIVSFLPCFQPFLHIVRQVKKALSGRIHIVQKRVAENIIQQLLFTLGLFGIIGYWFRDSLNLFFFLVQVFRGSRVP